MENDASDSDEAKQPDDKAATPDAVDGENQRRLNKESNQLSYRWKKFIKIWLPIITAILLLFGVLIKLAENLGYFDQFHHSGIALKEHVKQAERDAEEAKHLVDETRSHRDEAEKMVKAMREMTAEIDDDSPNKRKQIAREIESNPESTPLKKAIARAFSLQQDKKTDLDIGEWENIAKRAVGEDDDLAAVAWFAVGGSLLQKPEAAISAYDKAINLMPDFAEAYSNRGAAKNDLGRNEDAITDYNEAIRLKPDLIEAYYNRGKAKNDLGRHEAAIADYTEAIRLKPDNAEAFNNRGKAKGSLGRNEAAIVDYDKAIQLKPNNALAYNNRGNAKGALGRNEAAIADYDEAIRLKRDYALAYNNRGVAKDVLGRHEAAIADYDEAIRLKPDFAEVYSNRGTAKDALGRHEAAIADYDEAIRLKPDVAVAYYNRGNAKDALGNHEAAIADYDEAIRLKPDYAKAYHNRGIEKGTLHRIAELRKDFQAALALARKTNNEKLAGSAEQLLRRLDGAGGL